MWHGGGAKLLYNTHAGDLNDNLLLYNKLYCRDDDRWCKI